MILRELHFDEWKFAVTGVDSCDESVMRHVSFPRQRERFMFERKRKTQNVATECGNN
jgi:hypothetical protein